MTTLQFLKAFKGLTVLDVATTETETKFYLMCTGDAKFSDLLTIKERLDDVKDIIVYMYDSRAYPNGEQCQMEIIVENEKMESGSLPSESDSVTTRKRYAI